MEGRKEGRTGDDRRKGGFGWTVYHLWAITLTVNVKISRVPSEAHSL